MIFDERQARSASTKDEAEQCLRDFIQEGLQASTPHHIGEHSNGFDLYLPWFMEVIEYVEPYPDRKLLSIPDLHRLYMDAAWALVTHNVLRPGPRTASADPGSNVYGKGFSVIEGASL